MVTPRLFCRGFSATACCCASVLAAQGEPAADKPLPIVVTGRGLEDTPSVPAYSVVDIDRDALLGTGSGQVEDALRSVAGFQQFRRSDSRSANPSAQGATLRALGGNATSRALVLLDGVPMADPFFGYVPFSALVPERLGSVRVTRGGGAGPFGAGALAGTIELNSADARTLDDISLQMLVNDRAESELGAAVTRPLGAGFASISARWDHGQGFFTTPRGQRVPATARAGYERWSVQLRGVAPLTDTVELQARGLVFADDRTLRFAGADSRSAGQDASLRLVGRGRWQFDLLGYVQARDFGNVVVSSTRFAPTLDQRSTPSTGLGAKLELRPPTGRNNVLRLGADYRLSSGELYEDALNVASGAVTARRNAGGQNSDLGVFIENDLTLGAFTVTAGARADRYTIRDGFFREANAAGIVTIDDRFDDRAGWESSLRGGAVLRLGGGATVRVATYSSLRLPSLNELYRPFVVFPVVTQANPALRNERLDGFEVGIDFVPSNALRMSVTAFDNRVKDAIANVTIAPNLRQRRNIDAIEARGIELSSRILLGALQLDGSLAWTDAKSRGTGAAANLDGMRPAQTPRLAAAGTLGYRAEAGWRLSLTVRHVGAQFEDDLETDLLPAATTIDAYGEFPLTSAFTMVVRGENLTGEAVVTRNQGGSIDLGTPRTVWAGVKIAL